MAIVDLALSPATWKRADLGRERARPRFQYVIIVGYR